MINVYKIGSLFIALAIIFFTGCTIKDGNAIVVGNIKTPISPNEVRVYRTAPDKFEEIAIVSASAGHDFLKNSSLMNSAIEMLKIEAAKVGANGVILTDIDERDTPNVVTGYSSTTMIGTGGGTYATGNVIGVNRGDAYTRLRGIAIYVPKQ